VADTGITVNSGGTLSIGAASTAALGSKIALKGTGQVVTPAAFTFTNSGAALTAGSTLKVTGGSGDAAITTKIPAAGADPAISEAEVSGNITLSGGSLTYTHAVAGNAYTQLNISGKIKAQRGNNAYDTAELGGTKITGTGAGLVVTFNGATGAITLGTAVIVGAGGSLTTTGTGTGAGALAFSNGATLTTGTNNGQAVTLTTLPELRGTGIEGDLALTGDNSVLTLGTAGNNFTVLSAATAIASAKLTISGGAKVVGNGASLALLGATGRSGSFTNGTFTLRGVENGGPVGTYDNGIKTVPDGEIVELGPEDFYGAFGTGVTPLGTLTVGTGSSITSFTNSVLIPLAATKSLTAGSKLYSSN
jgi:hypothetical protein